MCKNPLSPASSIKGKDSRVALSTSTERAPAFAVVWGVVPRELISLTCAWNHTSLLGVFARCVSIAAQCMHPRAKLDLSPASCSWLVGSGLNSDRGTTGLADVSDFVAARGDTDSESSPVEILPRDDFMLGRDTFCRSYKATPQKQ